MVFNVQACNPEPGAQMIIGPTIIDDTQSVARQNEIDYLEHIRVERHALFVSTDAFVESASVLDEYHLLVVTGAPGMGKTFNSQQLLLQVCDEKLCNPFQPTVPEQYLQWCNTRERQAFLMDDVFGASSFNQAKYDAWMNVFPKMIQHVKSGNTYLIFACRENILKSHLAVLKTTGIFNNVINLSDEKFQLTAMNKLDIFLLHTNKFNIDIKYRELENIHSVARDPIGFPQRVHLFCSMVNANKETRLRYFNCPMEYLSTVVGSYRESDHVAYCILILVLLNDGQLPVSFLKHSNESSEQLQLCLDICDIPTSTMGALRNKADSLCNSLLLLVNGRYVYQHPSVMGAVTLDFGQRYPSDILENCSVSFLLERVFTQNSAPSDNEYLVILEPIMFPQLCSRLLKEITQCVIHENSLRSLASYAVFKDGVFNQMFLSHMQDNASFQLLFTSSTPDSPHPTFLFLAAASGHDALVHDVLSAYFSDVQRQPGYMNQLDRVLYAACNSASAVAVGALLAAGARADCKTTHDPDHVRLGWWDEQPTCTTLMHTAYSGSVEVLELVVDRLQQQHVDVTEHVCIEDGNGRTALHWWAQGGRRAVDALQILIEAGVDINAGDQEGQTALHWIARSGDSAAVSALLEAGADVHISCGDQTSLEAAVYYGHTAVAELLLSCIASDDLERWSVQTLVKHLFTKDSAPVDNKYVVILQPGTYPQLCARLVEAIQRCVCIEGDPRSLRSLSTYHVFRDPTFLDFFLQYLQDTASFHLLFTSLLPVSQHLTFLFLSAASGHDALVQKVLSQLHDVQRQPGFIDHLDRVLYAACNSGCSATVRALLANGARADYSTAHDPGDVRDGRWGGSPTCNTMMHAAFSGSVEVLQLVIDHLQQHGVDVVKQVHIRDGRGMTALHWWAREERGEVALKILMKAGADVNARDEVGRTALHFAAENGHTNLVQLLVKAGADVDLRASSRYIILPYTDQTPLEIAILRGHTAVADFFRSLLSK